MKITITFEQEEKEVIMSALEIDPKTDIYEAAEGRFGSYEYDITNNAIIAEFTPSFIKSMARLMASAVSMVKSFMNTCEMFGESWFTDIKRIGPKTDESKEDTITSVSEEITKEVE